MTLFYIPLRLIPNKIEWNYLVQKVSIIYPFHASFKDFMSATENIHVDLTKSRQYIMHTAH